MIDIWHNLLGSVGTILTLAVGYWLGYCGAKGKDKRR